MHFLLIIAIIISVLDRQLEILLTDEFCHY